MRENIIKEARKHLSLLCKEPNRFRMTIPVQEDDSDMIFVRAFNYAEQLERQLEEYKQAVEKVMK